MDIDMNTNYLTGTERTEIASQARTFAISNGWAPEHIESFPTYAVNRSEMVRRPIADIAVSFRIAREF